MASIPLDDSIMYAGLDEMEQVRSSQLQAPLQRVNSLQASVYTSDTGGPWDTTNVPVVAASGTQREVHFNPHDKVEVQRLAAPLDLPQLEKRAQTRSGPPIPEKSSKRSSAHPINFKPVELPSNKKIDDTSSISRSFVVDNNRSTSSAMTGVDINQKIVAMLAATEAMNAAKSIEAAERMNSSSDVQQAATKKRHLFGNKVLAKMKNAFNTGLRGANYKKRHNSLHEELLEPSFNKNLQDEHGSNTPDLTLDIRANEGQLL